MFKRTLTVIVLGALLAVPSTFASSQQTGREPNPILTPQTGLMPSPTASRYQDRAKRGEIPREAFTAVIEEQDDFEALDKNNNGKLSVNEFRDPEAEEELFDSINKNGDIFLSRKEIQEYKVRHPNVRWNFDMLNNDDNTHVSKKEFFQLNNRTPMVFDVLDRDHDKSLSEFEADVYLHGSGSHKKR